MVQCKLGLHQLDGIYVIGVQTYVFQQVFHLVFCSVVWAFTGKLVTRVCCCHTMKIILVWGFVCCFFFLKKIGHLCCPLTFLFWIAGKQLCCEHGRTFATLLLFYCKAGNSQWLSNLWNCRSILFGLGTSIARKCFGLNQENKGLIFSL